MIAAALISESVIDRSTFLAASKQVTGENHITEVDRCPGLSRLADELNILRDFTGGQDVDMSTAVTMLGFMVVGHCKEVDEFLQYTRGLPYCETKRTEMGIRCVVVTGAVCDWQRSVIEGNRWTLERSGLRRVFNEMHALFCQKGLSYLFDDFRTVHNGNILMLEHK